jgi:hypothetical protein
MLMGGVEHTDLIPQPVVMGLVGHNGHGIRPMGEGIDPHHHAHIIALGMGLGMGLTAGGSSGLSGTGLSPSGGGLYVSPHGGKLSKIGQAFNKAFNPQKNGVAQAVQKTIVAPIQHDIVNPVVKVGDQIKTGVVNTYNTAKTGFNKTFTPQVGKDIVSDLKTTGKYAIPAILGGLGGLAGSFVGGPAGGMAGSALGAYGGYKADQALGISGNTDFVGMPNARIKGTGMKKRERKPKGGELKKGAVKEVLDKTWKAIPTEFHQPLEDLGRASAEYAGYKLPPKKRTPVGKGVKGSKSKTHKGDMDYTTKKGDMDFHRGGHDEIMPETGTGLKKGSPEMKAKMAKLRAMKGKGKVSGTGIAGKGQVDNNSPHSGAIRMSPYQNF